MPKDAKKRSRKDSDTSASGPDDPTPVKKSSKPKSGGGGSSSSGKPCAIPGDEKSGEPSWSLGNMKFVKVSRILLLICILKSTYFFFSSLHVHILSLRFLTLLLSFPSGSRVQGEDLHRHPWVLHRPKDDGNQAGKEGNIPQLPTIPGNATNMDMYMYSTHWGRLFWPIFWSHNEWINVTPLNSLLSPILLQLAQQNFQTPESWILSSYVVKIAIVFRWNLKLTLTPWVVRFATSIEDQGEP